MKKNAAQNPEPVMNGTPHTDIAELPAPTSEEIAERSIARFSPLISAFSVPTFEGIIYTPGHPRPYRADCKAGVFKIGENNVKGREMAMEVLSYRTFEAELFNYPRQSWLEMFFVDAENTLSHTLFKGFSIDSFIMLYTELSVKKRGIGEGVVMGKMEKRSGKEGDYFVVEFSWRENTPERIQELKRFAESNALVNARFSN